MSAENQKPEVAILVVPRERFSLTESCLEHIYAFTQGAFEVIVVDGNAPKELSTRLKRWQSTKSNLKLVRTENFLYPHEAKNLAFKQIADSVKWVVLIDNDVKVSPAWLDWMVRAGEEEKVRVVHPLYLIEQKGHDSIHMAWGEYKKFNRNGKELIQPVMRYVGDNIVHCSSFKRQESDFVEFHCVMFRRDLIEEMGEFPPVHLAEDMDYSLRLREKNEKMIFEPRSVINYIAGPPFEKSDIPYFKYRRALNLGEKTVKMLCERWPNMMGQYWEGKLSWLKYHRSRISAFYPVVSKIRSMQSYSKTARKIAKLLPQVKGEF